uniref:Uncharacterized protein n=1 Tax=Myoviridae sp. ctCo31 TaxID=2825053 RepID=A0A8S5ULZ9_9CAUD|nr:MAG TPA: hypothetical protein [Myoviridae sp. ctCo31]
MKLLNKIEKLLKIYYPLKNNAMNMLKIKLVIKNSLG